MKFYLNAHVKFRIFGITLGTVEETVEVSADLITKAITWGLSSQTPPPGAKTVIDARGVRVSIWL